MMRPDCDRTTKSVTESCGMEVIVPASVHAFPTRD
jgi:hypothetical protein